MKMLNEELNNYFWNFSSTNIFNQTFLKSIHIWLLFLCRTFLAFHCFQCRFILLCKIYENEKREREVLKKHHCLKKRQLIRNSHTLTCKQTKKVLCMRVPTVSIPIKTLVLCRLSQSSYHRKDQIIIETKD